MNYWKKWKYKHLTLFFISVVFALYLARLEVFHAFLVSLGNWGYVGALISGILFVSTLTVSTGAVILVILAEKISPIELAVIAGFGGMIGDFAILRFFKDGLLSELIPIYNSLGGKYIALLLRSKYFRWLLRVVGAIIIVSPFPDELGVSLMGITKIKNYQFLLLTFTLDTIGVFLFIVSVRALISI